MPSIALVTIGQAPRDDLAAPILQALPADVQVRQYGLLDGLTAEEVVRRFTPKDRGFPLVTQLAGAQEVLVDGQAISRMLQAMVERLDGLGVDAIVMLCTGTFDEARPSRARLVQPDRVVPIRVAQFAGERQVGVIVPSARQLEWRQQKWAGLQYEPRYASASPYGPVAAVCEAARSLGERGAEMIVLDCMGYGARHREMVEAETGLPVLVSAELVAESLPPGLSRLSR